MCKNENNDYNVIMDQVAKEFVNRIKDIKTDVKYYTLCEHKSKQFIASVYNVDGADFYVKLSTPEPINFDNFEKIVNTNDGSLFLTLKSVASKKYCRLDFDPEQAIGQKIVETVLVYLVGRGYIKEMGDKEKLNCDRMLYRRVYNDLFDKVDIPTNKPQITSTAEKPEKLRSTTNQHKNIHYDTKYTNESIQRFRNNIVDLSSIKTGITNYLDKLKKEGVNFKELENKQLELMSNDIINTIDKVEKYNRGRKMIGDINKNDDQLI